MLSNKRAPMIIWATLAVFYFYQFIARSSFPTVLTDEFMSYFHLDSIGVGALVSCYYIVYTLMQIPAGIIVDKYSSRLIATLATSVCAIGAFMFVATSDFYIAGFGQMLIGFGSAFAFIITLKSITNWFPANKVAIMVSYTMSVGCIGPVVGGPAISQIVKHFEWKSVILIFSAIGILLATLVWIIVKDKEQNNDEKEKVSLVGSLKTILVSPQAWILALFTMALYSPLSALGDLWGVSFIKKAYNVDSTVAAFANSMLYVGMVIGPPSFAYLATLLDSYKKPMIIGAVAASISAGLVIFCTNLPIEAVFALFLITGFSCGAMLSYPLGMMTFSRSMEGTVTGFINMMSMVSGVILMPLIGWIINVSWDGTIENGMKVYSVNDYRYGLTTVLIFLVSGVILSLMVKDRSPKEKR